MYRFFSRVWPKHASPEHTLTDAVEYHSVKANRSTSPGALATRISIAICGSSISSSKSHRNKPMQLLQYQMTAMNTRKHPKVCQTWAFAPTSLQLHLSIPDGRQKIVRASSYHLTFLNYPSLSSLQLSILNAGILLVAMRTVVGCSGLGAQSRLRDLQLMVCLTKAS